MNEKFTSPCPPPSPAEREIIQTMIEEASEVAKECQLFIQRATKALRFGIKDIEPGQEHSNGYRLGHEFGELEFMVNAAIKSGIIPVHAAADGYASKSEKWPKFQQQQSEPVNYPVQASGADYPDWMKGTPPASRFDPATGQRLAWDFASAPPLPREGPLVDGDRVRIDMAIQMGTLPTIPANAEGIVQGRVGEGLIDPGTYLIPPGCSGHKMLIITHFKVPVLRRMREHPACRNYGWVIAVPRVWLTKIETPTQVEPQAFTPGQRVILTKPFPPNAHGPRGAYPLPQLGAIGWVAQANSYIFPFIAVLFHKPNGPIIVTPADHIEKLDVDNPAHYKAVDDTIKHPTLHDLPPPIPSGPPTRYRLQMAMPLGGDHRHAFGMRTGEMRTAAWYLMPAGSPCSLVNGPPHPEGFRGPTLIVRFDRLPDTLVEVPEVWLSRISDEAGKEIEGGEQARDLD